MDVNNNVYQVLRVGNNIVKNNNNGHGYDVDDVNNNGYQVVRVCNNNIVNNNNNGHGYGRRRRQQQCLLSGKGLQ